MLITYAEPAPPIVVRMLADYGKLPGGITVQFPHESTAHNLIANRLAIPVADFSVTADLTLDESDLEQIGLGDDYWRDLATDTPS
jgi:hypothetical protein